MKIVKRKCAINFIEGVKYITPTEPFPWHEMDGETELEQRINAYLTTKFVGTSEIPSDECLDEAKEVIRMMNYYGT